MIKGKICEILVWLSLANCFLGSLGVEALALAACCRRDDIDIAAIVNNALLSAALQALLPSLLLYYFGSLILYLACTRKRPVDLPHFLIIRTPPLI